MFGVIKALTSAWNTNWERRYFELHGTELSVYELKNTADMHQTKVLLEIIELTEDTFPREIKLERDKHGVADGKQRVISLVTAKKEEDENLPAAKKKIKSPKESTGEHELDILIHVPSQPEYDALFRALKKIKKDFDDAKHIYIGDQENQKEYKKF